MQIDSQHKNKGAELDLILARWENRYELRMLSRTVPRSLIAASTLGLAICAVGYLRLGLRPEQLALVNAGLLALSFLLNLIYTLLFPRSRGQQARYFDILFGLRERMSTALELLSGRLMTHPEIEARQIADALIHARRINAREAIALDFRPRELALLMILLLALSAAILAPLITGRVPTLEAPSPAIEAAEEDLREIIEAVATDSNLDDIDRRELLNALEIALERLREEDISEEEAFAAMSQLGAQIDEIQNELGETIELDQSMLEAAAEALSDFIPPEAADGELMDADERREASTSGEDLSQALEEMAQAARQMSGEEAQALAESLRQAAEEMLSQNPELAQRFQDMADALEAGDDEALREQLERAQQDLAQQDQQQQRNQESMTLMQEQEERAQEAADQIAQQQAESNEQPAPSAQQGDTASSEGSDQPSGQQGQMQSDEAESGANQGSQQPDRNRVGMNQESPDSSDSRGGGAGAGEGEADNRSLAGGGGEDQGADINNQTTGAGQIEYEAIYNPRGIGGGGEEEIRLHTDASDQTLAEGDFDENPLGESRVGYDTVYNDYERAANRALESDYVPLGLRDVVREYFTSLDPNGG